MTMRFALINDTDADKIERFLPSNYAVSPVLSSAAETMIVGEDVAGWTLDDYVLPRLASGLIFGQELKGSDATLARLILENSDLLLDYPWLMDHVWGVNV